MEQEEDKHATPYLDTDTWSIHRSINNQKELAASRLTVRASLLAS